MSDLDGIARGRERGVDEHGVAARLHGLSRMRRRAEPSVDDDRNGRLVDDDLDGIAGAKAAIRPDPRPEWHHRRSARLLEALGEDRIGADVRKDDEFLCGKHLGRAERLDRIG
jgi:hypothetical protein